jgi:nanoRNase/pAp phosphatase (c-di-AMP/oligoRNAs hydrolase)
MDNLTLSKIKEGIEKYNSIGIITPNNPSVDIMAGALSLYLSLKTLGKNLSIATPSQPLVEVSALVGIDEVKTSLGAPSGDLVVSFPYREGEIEKVSYTRDDNILNIVVKAGENGLNFNEKDVKFTRGSTAPEFLFIVGASRVSDLGKLFDPAGLKDTVVVNIDNSPENQGFGDIVMVSNRFSSVSESIADLITALNFKIDLDIAQNLMLGIAVATDNFQNPSTSPLAFEMAGIMLRNGALRPTNQTPRRKLNMEFDEKDEPVQQRPVVSEVSMDAPVIQSVEHKESANPQNPPEDWLEPKIYKGSTNF